ncbi:MAG TPA: glycerophosphodiester phosphodiesterase family protein, partial [Steroidobacteraceae bacterium]|nr:glycerophosphodiester phosphodiesterase family protein [Steroidobacteraceae bacterium]
LGLRFVEFDVQLSADRVPYLIHDASLTRTTRAAGDLRLMGSGQLDGIDAGEPARFGDRHSGTTLPRLAAAAELMRGIPQARAFVEIKRASLAHHGHARCIERILEGIDAVKERCVAISFDAEACRLVRSSGGLPVGWVLHDTPQSSLAALEALQPEYAFCDQRLLPSSGPLPQGSWDWAVYEVTDGASALRLGAQGVTLVETMAPARLLRELGPAAGPA